MANLDNRSEAFRLWERSLAKFVPGVFTPVLVQRRIPNPGHVVEKQTDNLVDCDFTHSELLDVTLVYLKGKDAESEEAQEPANSSSLALCA